VSEFFALRINPNQDTECISWDLTKYCVVGSRAECEETLKKAETPQNKRYSCGEIHKKFFGQTGYEDPNHWCN